MAYHVGRILALDFGLETFAVTVEEESAANLIFDYDQVFPVVTLQQLEQEISPQDILICNPSFSFLGLGHRLRCIKICYVQGFNTFTIIDKFDHYISASRAVQDVLNTIYRLDTPIIHPFIEIGDTSAPEWWARPERSALILRKGPAAISDAVQAAVSTGVDPIAGLEKATVVEGVTLRHKEFLELLGRHRFLINLSPAEGFGLVPLEAMALGTTVMGFDSVGGRDYMQPSVNCATVTYPDVSGLIAQLDMALSSPDRAAELARAGRDTARRFTYDAFRQRWRDVLDPIVSAHSHA